MQHSWFSPCRAGNRMLVVSPVLSGPALLRSTPPRLDPRLWPSAWGCPLPSSHKCIGLPLYPTVCQAAGPLGARPYKECRAWLPILVPPFLATPSSRPIPPRPPARCDRVPSQGLSPVSTAPGTNLARRATPRLAPASLETYAASDRSRTDRQPPLPPAGNLSGGGRGEPSRASPGPQ